MAKKRTYSTVSVESLSVDPLVRGLAGGAIVALDVAKSKFVGAIATASGEPLTLFRFEHPTQTRTFLELVRGLRDALGAARLRVAMEPTGTYGDAIRYQLAQLGVPVWMVSPKKTHDSQSLFDGVPSMHDPKSAVHVAKLCGMGLATEWRSSDAERARLRALVELRGHELDHEDRCFGRIEAALARHWPEFNQHLDVRSQKSALALLASFPSPALATANRGEAAKLLRETSRSQLSIIKAEGLLNASASTLGVPTMTEQEAMIGALARQAAEARNRAEQLDDQMNEVGKDNDVFGRLKVFMGTFTAATIIAMCDPLQYATARQLEKACGLNLREKSSGEVRREHVRLRITKRGPSLVRKVLYLFALRTIQQYPEARAWYMRRQKYALGHKQAAVTALMRKLVRAVFHVARGAEFKASALFDVRRLEKFIRDLQAAKTTRPRRAHAATPVSVTA
jgi:transposase